ncbi:MAG TPA: dUTPase [Candidatus Nitrosocosmicus sp.]
MTDKDKTNLIDDSDLENNSQIKNKTHDKLDILFNKQNELFKKNINNNNKNKMNNLYDIEEPFEGYRIFMLSSALIHEAIELQRETNWKWWKKTDQLNENKIQEEIIDLWHFLIQISIEVGLDSETVVEKYIEKNLKNIKRQENDY